MPAWKGACSGGVQLLGGPEGHGVLQGDRYRRATPYPSSFLEKLASAFRGAALVEELLVAEEPGRLALRVAPLLEPGDGALRVLHWGAAALAATVSIARLGLRIDAVDTNPLWEPLGRERLGWTGLEDRVRVVAPERLEGGYGLLLLVGERAARPELPPADEIERAVERLDPGGRILLIGWPRGTGLPSPLAGWRPVRRTPGRLARQRLLRPRGEAPVPRRMRGLAGLGLAPLTLAAPDLVLVLLGERNVSLRRGEGR